MNIKKYVIINFLFVIIFLVFIVGDNYVDYAKWFRITVSTVYMVWEIIWVMIILKNQKKNKREN